MEKIKDWVASLPPLILGPLVVAGGLFFMTLADPPRTKCDAQFEEYKNKTNDYIFAEMRAVKKKVSSRVKVPPKIEQHHRECLRANSAGGCYRYIKGLRDWWRVLKTIPSTCGGEFEKIKPSKKWLEKSVDTFVQIAWGSAPPETFRKKTAWLDRSDLIIYCGLKREYIRFFGGLNWKEHKKKLLMGLPEAKTLEARPRWEKTILSIPCDKVLMISE